MTAFDASFDRLVGNEGGYSNNPKDPGGETMWGVTARVARAHGYTGPMHDLPRDMAKQIAYATYWKPLHLDEFDERIAFQVFDANYNGGHPVIWMQAAAGAKVDGLIGPNTVTAVKAANPWIFQMKFLAYRVFYYTSLRTWLDFGKGWANRIGNNLLAGAR